MRTNDDVIAIYSTSHSTVIYSLSLDFIDTHFFTLLSGEETIMAMKYMR